MIVSWFHVGDSSDDEEFERNPNEEPQAMVDRLCLLYNQGVPFFSKSTFRDIVRQLDHHRANPHHPAHEIHEDDPDLGQDWPAISIARIDGTVAKARLKTGCVKPGDKKNTEFILMSPHLKYKSFQTLCHDILMSYVSRTWAYCPVRLLYPLQRRRIHTGKLLGSFKRDAPEAVRDAFEAGITMWEQSPDCRRLRELFDAALPPGVNKVVAFACSTMTANSRQKRTVCQHAMVLTLLDILQRRRRDERQPDIQCFAQDPFYTDTNEEILTRAGVTVVQDPRGFLEVDDQTMVVSISPDVPIRQIITDIARPAVLIWNKVEFEAKDAEYRTDPESPRLWAMIQNEYDEAATLEDEEMFGHSAVYIRRGMPEKSSSAPP